MRRGELAANPWRLLRAERDLRHRAYADTALAGASRPAGAALGARLSRTGLRRCLRTTAASRVIALGLGVLRIARADRRIRLQIFEAEHPLARLLLNQHAHDAALFQRAKQNLLGERLLDVLLDDARQRPGAELVVIAPLGEPRRCLRRQLDGDVAVAELRLELEHEFLHHLGDDLRREAGERNDRVEPVAELRAEQPVDRLLVVAFALGAIEADGRLG